MRLFSPDSPFMSALSLLADIVIVNVLMVLSSLPIVTGGAALRAGNVVMGRMASGVGSRYGLHYLKEFTRQWKVSTLWWFVLLCVGALVAYQQWVVFQAGVKGSALFVIQAAVLSGLLIMAGISVWLFAQQGAPSTDEGATECRFAPAVQRAVLSLFAYPARSAASLLLLLVMAVLPVMTWGAWGAWLFFFLAAGPALGIFLIRLILAKPLGLSLGD